MKRPYDQSGTYWLQAIDVCVKKGGNLATFPSNSQSKMAAAFKWLATQYDIQLAADPIDHWQYYTPCVFMGIYHRDSQWWWETSPPTPIDNSLIMHRHYGYPYACVIPHKERPLIRSHYVWWTWSYHPVMCQIQNPCTHQCKAGASRVFDRCQYGTSSRQDRLAAQSECTDRGAFLASVLERYENWYWRYALINEHPSTGLWIGYNHLTCKC